MTFAAEIQETKFLIQILNAMINSNKNEHSTYDNQETIALSKSCLPPTFKSYRNKLSI